jgi:hypothetical protein
LEFVGSYDVGLTCRMAATWKPAVGAEIWACSLAFGHIQRTVQYEVKPKQIDRIAATRFLLSWYECAVVTLLGMSVGYYRLWYRCPSTASLGLAQECELT